MDIFVLPLMTGKDGSLKHNSIRKKIDFLSKSLKKRELELHNNVRAEIDKVLDENGMSCGMIINRQNICQLMSMLMENGNKPIKVNYDIWKE